MRINSAGNVGIGTDNPFGKLQVHAGDDANFSFSTGGGEASLEILNDAGSANVPLNIRASEYKIKIQGNEKLRIASNGLVGIGTTIAQLSSSERLSVNQALTVFRLDSATTGPLYLRNANFSNANNPYLVLQDGTGNRGGVGIANNDSAMFIHGQNGIRFRHSGTSPGTKEAMRISTTGLVGIGTDNPTTKLTTSVTHSNSAVADALRLTTTGAYSTSNSEEAGPALTFGQYHNTYSTWKTAQVAGIRDGANWHGALSFYTNSGGSQTDITEKVRITADGDMGLGTSSPNHYNNYSALTINGSTGAEIDFEANGTLIGDIFANSGGLYLNTRTADPIVFSTNNGSSFGTRGSITAVGSFIVGDFVPVDDRNVGGLHITNSRGVSFKALTTQADSRNWRIRNDDMAWGALDFSVGSTNNNWGSNASGVVMSLTKEGRLLNGHNVAVAGAYNNSTQTRLLQVVNGANTGDQGIGVYSFNTAGWGPRLEFGMSLNATKGSHTAVGSDTALGFMLFSGSDGTNFSSAASVSVYSDGTVANDQVPGRIRFHTSGENTSGLQERMAIRSSGVVDASMNTTAVALPTGTTAQRPSGTDAYIRKNSTNNALEFYNGTEWVEIITDYFPTGSTILG